MFRQYYPSAYVDSVFTIDYDKLYARGYRGLIFDVDNTLAHHGEDSTAEVDDLFRELHQMGFKTVLLSNNNAERLERFTRNIDTSYIDEADKPEPRAFNQAVEMMGLRKEQVICIGDQVFTDIRGANRCGLASILVRYMRYPNEKKIGIRRRIEKVLLWCYRHSRASRGELSDIQKGEGLYATA